MALRPNLRPKCSGKQIKETFFTPLAADEPSAKANGEANSFRCRCGKVRVQNLRKGYTNLTDHVMLKHPDWIHAMLTQSAAAATTTTTEPAGGSRKAIHSSNDGMAKASFRQRKQHKHAVGVVGKRSHHTLTSTTAGKDATISSSKKNKTKAAVSAAATASAASLTLQRAVGVDNEDEPDELENEEQQDESVAQQSQDKEQENDEEEEDEEEDEDDDEEQDTRENHDQKHHPVDTDSLVLDDAPSCSSCATSKPDVSATDMTKKRESYISWDDYFMSVAFLSAMRSKDPSTQVGACIVNEDMKIVGIGYNGFPNGCCDDELPWARHTSTGNLLDTKYPFVCHAEMNAILNKNNSSLKNCTIYVALFPCNECAKLIIQSGIRKVVYVSDKYHDDWQCVASRKMFDMAGIAYVQHVPSTDRIVIDFTGVTRV